MLDQLILLRLLALPPSSAEAGETVSKIRADLRPLASGESSASASRWAAIIAAAVGRLEQAGAVTRTGRGGARLRLTDAGRAQARETFAVPETGSPPATGKKPRKKTPGWAWWRDHFALPKALGTPAVTEADGLRAALLRQLFLPDMRGTDADLLAVIDQLLAKELITPRASLSEFRHAALRRWLAGTSAETAGDEQHSTGVVADKPAQSETAATTPIAAPSSALLPDDLSAFADLVLTMAQRTETGRFGDNKIFISHVWRALLAAGRAGEAEANAFKEKLIRANTAGALRLSRADLAGAHDPQSVRDSEVCYLGESFHFIRLE